MQHIYQCTSTSFESTRIYTTITGLLRYKFRINVYMISLLETCVILTESFRGFFFNVVQMGLNLLNMVVG